MEGQSTVMASFNYELGTIYNHLERESQGGIIYSVMLAYL